MARAEKGDEKDERKGRRLQPSGFDFQAALPAAPPQDECDSSVFKAAAMDKRTPLKHERVVVVTAESPPDGLCSAANSPTSLGPDGYAVQEGTPRLKLKLTAVHPALTQLIQRCGFNAQLQVSFNPGGKSIGRYFTSSSTQRAFAIFAALDLVVRGCGGVLT